MEVRVGYLMRVISDQCLMVCFHLICAQGQLARVNGAMLQQSLGQNVLVVGKVVEHDHTQSAARFECSVRALFCSASLMIGFFGLNGLMDEMFD